MQALFLAMAIYPEVQKKAQAEIDTAVGPHRLPDFEDRPSLPYINAIVKELMRWHVVVPLCAFIIIIIIITVSTILTDHREAIPHMATNDDEYDGYYIPKGTVLFGSAWPVWMFTEPYIVLTCLFLGPYCVTPKFLTTPWSTSLNGI